MAAADPRRPCSAPDAIATMIAKRARNSKEIFFIILIL
jgi:hypothetical protein